MDKDESFLEWDREQRFRHTISYVLGWKKGNISKALNEAVDLYIEKYRDRVPEMPPRVIESES